MVVDVDGGQIRYETWGEGAAVELPVLLGVAGCDEYMSTQQRLLELLPQAEIVAVPDAGHAMILSDERFRGAVLSFLRPSTNTDQAPTFVR